MKRASMSERTSRGDAASQGQLGLWRGAKWIRLGRVAGVSIAIDAGLLVLLAGGLVLGLAAPSPGTRALSIALVLASVVVHELGHALMARTLGVSVGGVYLHVVPFAAIDAGEPESKSDGNKMLCIALAGPMASMLVASVCWLLGARFALGDTSAERLLDLPPLTLLLWVNAVMGTVNLLPALPVDGGRALEAWVRPRVSWRRRHGILAGCGWAVALGVAVVAYVTSMPLRLPIALLAGIFLLTAIHLGTAIFRRPSENERT